MSFDIVHVSMEYKWKRTAILLGLALLLNAAHAADDDDKDDDGKTDDDDDNSSDEKRLMEHLFKGYDRRVRPIRDSSEEIEVSVSYKLNSMISLDEVTQELEAFGLIEMEWKDEFLQWDKDEYNLSYIVVNSKDIWIPDLIIANSINLIYGDIFDHEKFRAVVQYDGNVTYSTCGKTETFCLLDMTYFPFDVQACYIEIGSFTYNEEQVVLESTADTIDVSGYLPNGQWKLDKTKVDRNSDSSVKFVVYISRKPMFYTSNLVIPCILMSLLVVFVFVLPADSEGKVNLSITVILSLSVFQLMVADIMPDTSDYVPLISVYIAFVMVMATLSLLLSIIVEMILHYPHSHYVPPQRLRRFVFGRLSKLLFMRICTESHSPPSKDDKDGETGRMLTDASDPESSGQQRGKAHRNGSNPILQELQPISSGMESSLVSSVVEFVKASTAKMKSDEEEASLAEQWLTIARVFDRLFLVVFVIVTFIVSVILLGLCPLSGPDMVEPKKLYYD